MATTTMSKAYFEDLGRIAQTNARSAQQSARIATDYWAVSRETNNEVAQGITQTLTEGMRRQTDANEELRSKIFEVLEEQTKPTSASSLSGPKRSPAHLSIMVGRPRARRRRRAQAQSSLLAV